MSGSFSSDGSDADDLEKRLSQLSKWERQGARPKSSGLFARVSWDRVWNAEINLPDSEREKRVKERRERERQAQGSCGDYDAVVLDQYDVHAELDHGSFGRVYMGVNKQTAQIVAIKKCYIKTGYWSKMNLQREAKAGRDLQHENLVPVYHSFTIDWYRYFIMDFMDNGDFLNRIVQEDGFTTDVTRFYTAELVKALTYLRSKNWVHRDIKPDNLLLDSRWHLRLCDFGLAVELPDGVPGEGERCGTDIYMPPEVQEEPFGDTYFTHDIWGLGIILFVMQSAIQPFAGGQPRHILDKLIKLGHFKPMEKDPDPLLETLFKAVTTIDPKQRLGARDMREIMDHPFYADIQWDKLQVQKPPKFKSGQPTTPEKSQMPEPAPLPKASTPMAKSLSAALDDFDAVFAATVASPRVSPSRARSLSRERQPELSSIAEWGHSRAKSPPLSKTLSSKSSDSKSLSRKSSGPLLRKSSGSLSRQSTGYKETLIRKRSDGSSLLVRKTSDGTELLITKSSDGTEVARKISDATSGVSGLTVSSSQGAVGASAGASGVSGPVPGSFQHLGKGYEGLELLMAKYEAGRGSEDVVQLMPTSALRPSGPGQSDNCPSWCCNPFKK